MTPITDWKATKITNWSAARELSRFYIPRFLGEMLVFESVAAIRLRLSGALNQEQQVMVEDHACSIINNAIDNSPSAKSCVEAVKELLNLASALIASKPELKDSFNYSELELVFKFIRNYQVDGYLPDIVGKNKERLDVFKQLLDSVIDKSHYLGINIPDFVVMYHLANFHDQEGSLYLTLPPSYTPAQSAGIGMPPALSESKPDTLANADSSDPEFSTDSVTTRFKSS